MDHNQCRMIVVDANVARSCGGEHASHPVPILCRNFLDQMRATKHKAVFSPKLAEEWDRHASNYAAEWRTDMFSRDQLVYVQPDPTPALEVELASICLDQGCLAAMKKDLHLVTAAVEADQTVASQDNLVRGYFSGAAHHIPVLRTLVWINPAEEEFDTWLSCGAHPEPARYLTSWRAHPLR